jgi:excisionase family DNA binding protein
MEQQHRQPEKLWSVTELCAALGIARSTAYDWVHQEFIPHVKLGGCVRFLPSAVQAWLDQQAKPGRVRRIPEVSV